MSEEAIILNILVIEADLKLQTDSGLPPWATRHGHKVAAEQEGIEDSLSLLICPKSRGIVLLFIAINFRSKLLMETNCICGSEYLKTLKYLQDVCINK